jgi:hypothetical protein
MLLGIPTEARSLRAGAAGKTTPVKPRPIRIGRGAGKVSAAAAVDGIIASTLGTNTVVPIVPLVTSFSILRRLHRRHLAAHEL